MTLDQQQKAVETEAFYGKLASYAVKPLWRQKGLLPAHPATAAIPYLWRYGEVRKLLLEAGAMITAEEAERRVLMLMNPGLDDEAAATGNLYAGLQLVLPGEIAPKHRHVASALRFVTEGSGAYTAVNGEKAVMEVGDMVLTPNWAWHDHGNESDEPMLWLDGLDIPLVNKLDVNFFDTPGEARQELTRPNDASERLYAFGRLNPSWFEWTETYSPVIKYPWSQTERILRDAASDGEGSPYDGIIFEYANPFTGGPALPMMSCFVQRLRPAFQGEAHRHTSSAVYHVVRGHGRTIVNGEVLEWEEKDMFAVPSWAAHEHANGSREEEAILFSFTEEPMLRPFDLYRERPEPRQA